MTDRNATKALMPFMLIVFLGYSPAGLPLSVLPIYVHAVLGYGTVVVGVVVGLSAAVTLLTRQVSGSLSDRHGPKAMMLAGLLVSALTGVAFGLASVAPPAASLWLLLLGRFVLGIGDSLFTTALMAWCIATVGVGHAGRVLSWIGLAMYGSLAVMAPLGEALYQGFGFAGVAMAMLALPLLAFGVAAVLPAAPSYSGERLPLRTVLAALWPLGTSLVLAATGFGTIAAFMALRYLELGWSGAGIGVGAYSVAYIVSRLFFAGLPDRVGGARLAVGSLAVEATGLLMIAFAVSPLMALTGSAMTGLGYSLVFPSLGVEAMRRVPPEGRGVALGFMLACFDLGLGAAGPFTGLVAAGFGLPSAFIAAALGALISLALVNGVRVRGLATPDFRRVG